MNMSNKQVSMSQLEVTMANVSGDILRARDRNFSSNQDLSSYETARLAVGCMSWISPDYVDCCREIGI